MAGVYRDAELAAGLVVKASASAVVLVHTPTLRRIERVQDWLRSLVPQWASVSVGGAARYMGSYIGPQAAA